MIGASHRGGRVGSLFAETEARTTGRDGILDCAATSELLLAAHRSAAARQQAIGGWRFWVRLPLMPFLCLWWAVTYSGD